jgi:hypothetical protein
VHKGRELRLSKLGGFLVRHAGVVILDLEESVDLLERQTGSLNEEIPNDWRKQKLMMPNII